MKKILFVLPLCAFLANCSSQKKTTTPPAGPGISNVNVSANGSAPTPVNASATSSTNRDWAYKSKYDTTLNGTWALQGMMGSTGSWTSLQDSSAAAANAMGTQAGMGGTTTGTTDASGATSGNMGTTGTTGSTGMTATTENMGSDNAMATNSTKTGTGKTKAKTKNNRAVYDSAKVRLGLDPTSPPSTIDSSLLQPYKYWGRTPVMTINATRHVFTGNTGCNSMSGSFNFSGNDIQFSRSINTSKMNCNEYDEANFLTALKKVDNYTINGDQLELKQGSTLLMTFKRRV
jgi:heat shock protein HslJ